ncbi:AtpZ/AtpI family protein [Fusibacter sp. 3D3]|uniref:AtpZ/AtpI family protein n=1 Tax=Fusibacter sp. 3D3 TaxID=1048380 RepID=UPI000852C342|nr:AtpZ/AtpI family protein [Fusibacter sp. 3D3]GAU75715.1 ATP synthase protein I [Fusibacter sp. 3D3]
MKKTTKSTMENLALISQVGIMMIVPIGFGVFAGDFLDDHFGTTPLFLIIMIVLGVGASFRNLMKLATTKSKEYKNDYTARTQVEQYAKEKHQEQRHLEQELDLDTLEADEANADQEEISKQKE